MSEKRFLDKLQNEYYGFVKSHLEKGDVETFVEEHKGKPHNAVEQAAYKITGSDLAFVANRLLFREVTASTQQSHQVVSELTPVKGYQLMLQGVVLGKEQEYANLTLNDNGFWQPNTGRMVPVHPAHVGELLADLQDLNSRGMISPLPVQSRS